MICFISGWMTQEKKSAHQRLLSQFRIRTVSLRDSADDITPRKPPPKPKHKQQPMRVANSIQSFPKRQRINTFFEIPSKKPVQRPRGFGEEEK